MTDSVTTLKVATFLRVYGERVIERLFRKDCCILATNIGMRVCHHFDIAAYPQAVKVDIWNDRAWRHAVAEQNSTAPARDYPSDGVVISVAGTGTATKSRWDGHLVLMLPTYDTEYLLDLTVDQFSRPQRGVTLPGSLVFELPPDWDRRDPTSVAGYEGFEDEHVDPPVRIFYRPMVDVESFRDSADWRDDWKGVEKITAQLVDACQAALSGTDVPDVDDVVERIAGGLDLKRYAELLARGA